MVASKKKRTLSSEDKLKMTLLYELLQWKGLDATAAALADEADLSVPSNQPTQSRSREEVWSRLSMLPQIKSETSSDAEEGSDSDSDSQSDTNSDPSESDSSDDSDSADSEEVNPPKKNLANTNMKENPGTSASISRSSASESDSDDEEETTSGSDTGGNDESSESDGSIDSAEEDNSGNPLKRKRSTPSSSSTSSSSASTDSDSDSEESNSTSESSSSSEEASSSSDEAPPKKVQKTVKKDNSTQSPPSPSLSKTLSPPAQRHVNSPPLNSSSPSDVHTDRRNQNGEPKRFSRIKGDVTVHPGVASNAYNAGELNYGAKAHKDLIVTRGDGFRKEKQKKKRGSYKGGAIDFHTRSFKFTD